MPTFSWEELRWKCNHKWRVCCVGYICTKKTKKKHKIFISDFIHVSSVCNFKIYDSIIGKKITMCGLFERFANSSTVAHSAKLNIKVPSDFQQTTLFRKMRPK